jgi:hypothetical protein
MELGKTITILLFILSCGLYAQGHDHKEQRDKIKSLKVAYFTAELSLTPNEAEKFWPVYNAYADKQFELRFQKMRPMKKKLHSTVDSMDDKEALSILNQIESTEDEIYQNRKKLTANLKKVISPIKILKLIKAEDDFNKIILRQYKNHHSDRSDHSDRYSDSKDK